MSTRHFLVLIACIGILCAACSSPEPPQLISFEEAAQVVLEQVVVPDELEGEIIVFGWGEPIQSGDVLSAYRPSPGEGLEPERGQQLKPEVGSWFFWIEDAPGAKFAHPNRFVLVDGVSAEVAVYDELWWPLLNDEPLWVETQDYWDEANWIFSNLSWRRSLTSRLDPAGVLVHAKTGPPGPARAWQPAWQIPSPGAAIVINAWDKGETLQEDFETDADAMHDIFSQSSFDTTYLGPEEDDNPDRDGGNDYDSISRWFSDQSRKLKPSQTLFVYLAGHGYVSSQDGQGVVGGISEGLLEIWLDYINPGVHIVVMVDSCYAGSFIDTMNQVADFTITSTNASDPSYGDIDPSEDPNPGDRGSEFTSGYVEDWNKILDDIEEIRRVRERAEREGINFYEALAGESYVTAVEKDAAAIIGRSFPMTGHGIPATRAAWTPVPTPRPPAQAGGTRSFQVRSAVDMDKAKHKRHIGMQDEYELTLEYTLSGVKLEAPQPFVAVEGSLEENGTFDTTGKGTVAGFPNIDVSFVGQIIGGVITGTYGMGVSGGLPQGEPIYYSIEGVEEEAPSGAATPQAGPALLSPDVLNFYEGFNQAFEVQDVDTLLTSLHPRVTDLYGVNDCTAYLEDVILNPIHVEVNSVSGPEFWNWVIDGQIIPVEGAYSVALDVTAGGQTVERQAHLAPLAGGALGPLGWFTDCGEPSSVLIERPTTGAPTTTPSGPSATPTTSATPPAVESDSSKTAATTSAPPYLLLCVVLLGVTALGGLAWWVYDIQQWPTSMTAGSPKAEPITDGTYQLKSEKECAKTCTEIRAAIRRPHRIRILQVRAHTLHKRTGGVIDTNVIPGNLADVNNIMAEFNKAYDVPNNRNGTGEEFLYREGRCDPGCKCVVPAGAQASKRKRTSRRFGMTFVKELERTLNKPFIDPKTGQETKHPDMMTSDEIQGYLSDADLLLPHQPGQPYRVKTTVRYEASLRVPVELRKYNGSCTPIRWDPDVEVA